MTARDENGGAWKDSGIRVPYNKELADDGYSPIGSMLGSDDELSPEQLERWESAEAIVYDLAAADEPSAMIDSAGDSRGGYCTICGANVVASPSTEAVDHLGSCPWRRAREYQAAHPATTGENPE